MRLLNGNDMKVVRIPKKYSMSFKSLHWLMGIGFVSLLIAGQQFNFPLGEAYRLKGLMLHSSVGVVVFLSALTLLLISQLSRRRSSSYDQNKYARLARTLSKCCLYTLALLVPISGFSTAYFANEATPLFGFLIIGQEAGSAILYERVRGVHEWLTLIAISIVCLHVAAAIYHHVVLKDNVLKSMLPDLKIRTDR